MIKLSKLLKRVFTKMNKQFFAILFIVIALLVGVFVLTKDEASSPTGGGQTSNHAQGAGNKGVTLIEYGDLQCSACKSYYPIIKQVEKEYGDDIRFIFRHFPLVQIHNNAFVAARAAEAAGLQGKFFGMHDLLYENQERWEQLPDPTQTFEQYAQQLELDIERFRTDMASEEVNSTINADLAEARAAGATATPTFMLNGKKVEENPRDVEGFKALIDEAIASAKKPQ
jgi:protein-disulfide isomerase